MSDPVKWGAVWNGTDPRTGQPYTFDGGYYYDSPVPSLATTEKKMLFHISLAFAQLSDNDLDEKASHVATQMATNAATFTSPPVTPAVLTTAQGNFHTALAAASEGGTTLTAAKNAKREILIGLLRQLAAYIEAIPGITQATAELSGFDTVTGAHHAASTPAVPVILALSNVGSGHIGVKLKGSAGARGYEFRVSAGAGAPVSAGIFSSTRDIVLTGLTPGTTYAVQVRALGAGNHASEWSPATNFMCT